MTTERLVLSGGGRSFNVGPSRVVVKVEDGEPNAAFSMIEWTIPPGAPAPPRHIHREGSETFYIVQGELTFPLADKDVTARAGTSLHIPPGTPHTLSNQSDGPAIALELFVPGSLMSLVEGVGALFAEGRPDPSALAALFASHASEIVG